MKEGRREEGRKEGKNVLGRSQLGTKSHRDHLFLKMVVDHEKLPGSSYTSGGRVRCGRMRASTKAWKNAPQPVRGDRPDYHTRNLHSLTTYRRALFA